MANGHDFFSVKLLERIAKEQYDTQKCALTALGLIVPAASSICRNFQLDCALLFKALRKVNLWTLTTLSVAELKTRHAQMQDGTFSRESCNSYGCTRSRTRWEGRRSEVRVNRPTCHVHCIGTNLTYG
jgi:hypothetical protein